MAVYVPAHFASNDRAAIARLVHDHPFATLITAASPEPLVTHLPLLHIADCEPNGTLLGHFARANPHWRHAGDGESIAIFHGPHAYVSPSWYAEPASAVPTWNYAVIHAHGTLAIAREPGETRAVLDLMIHRFESGRAAPWQLGLDGKRLAAMVDAIVGFRLKVKRIEAKFKMSQNRSGDDQRRVAQALALEPYAESIATAQWMKAAGEPPPDAQS
jgi:transcriptional regulator